MAKGIIIRHHGGPDVLAYENMAIADPGFGEVRVRNRAIGVNFIDIYLRTGAYRPPQMPFTPGKEGAGDIVAVGEGVVGFAPGDRVAYVETLGAYAEECIVPARFLVHLPQAIDFETAAALMLKGLTAQFLLRRTFRVKPGHTVLVHAAAGGVGLIMTQWAKALGAVVIGTVGSPAKAELARRNGSDHVIDYGHEDVAARVMEITNGQGCDAVYDGVGKATFQASLDSLRPFGHFVSFGSASGPIAPFDIMLLAEKGSLAATWQLLPHHIAKRDVFLAMCRELFDMVEKGAVIVPVHASYPLADAALAQERLETRQTSGATILLP